MQIKSLSSMADDWSDESKTKLEKVAVFVRNNLDVVYIRTGAMNAIPRMIAGRAIRVDEMGIAEQVEIKIRPYDDSDDFTVSSSHVYLKSEIIKTFS